MWSMGCILAELWTGSLLFSTHDEVLASHPAPLHVLGVIHRSPAMRPAHPIGGLPSKRSDVCLVWVICLDRSSIWRSSSARSGRCRALCCVRRRASARTAISAMATCDGPSVRSIASPRSMSARSAGYASVSPPTPGESRFCNGPQSLRRFMIYWCVARRSDSVVALQQSSVWREASHTKPLVRDPSREAHRNGHSHAHFFAQHAYVWPSPSYLFARVGCSCAA